MDMTVTYGWRIVEVVPGDPSDEILEVNDTIIAMNETCIRNGDDLSSFLEENTLPGDTVKLTILRKIDEEWKKMQISVTLGKRRQPTA